MVILPRVRVGRRKTKEKNRKKEKNETPQSLKEEEVRTHCNANLIHPLLSGHPPNFNQLKWEKNDKYSKKTKVWHKHG